MFTGGIGQISNLTNQKEPIGYGMRVIKIGGPAYAIGVGGGSASSRGHDTKNMQEDLNAVQRGDPEMENKLNRVIRRCIENDHNPIMSIHDQGAGGTGNVTKEIVYPDGAEIDLDKVVLGDKTMSPLEIWVSEYQESDTIITNYFHSRLVKEYCELENLPFAEIGEITNTGNIKVKKSNKTIVNLPLSPILGNIYKKNYYLEKVEPKLEKIRFSQTSNIKDLLIRVLKLPCVGSKRFLTNKVDRSVTGLIAQQQCVVPLHTPLSNYAVIAQSYFNKVGGVTSIGERPIIGSIDPRRMARMCVGEMLTNMIFAKITKMEDIRCSGTWMWANKFKGEKYALYEACKSMCDVMKELGIALDGGKDSLSMYYKEDKEIIKCPRSLVISGYAPTKDVTKKVTPDLKKAGNYLLYINFNNNNYRLGISPINKSIRKNNSRHGKSDGSQKGI